MNRFPVLGHGGKVPTMSMAILDHGSEMTGTKMRGAGGSRLPLPSRWQVSQDLQKCVTSFSM